MALVEGTKHRIDQSPQFLCASRDSPWRTTHAAITVNSYAQVLQTSKLFAAVVASIVFTSSRSQRLKEEFMDRPSVSRSPFCIECSGPKPYQNLRSLGRKG